MLTTIKHKSEGDLVKVAQYLTKFAAREKADGIFSADFTAHVISWQTANGLTADGVIGKKSWAKMAELAPLCTTSKNKKSRYTCALQILLGGLEADGVYGSKTKAAVAAYQAAVGLKADGKCGTDTWTALITGRKGAAQPAKGFKQPVDYKQGDSRWGSKMYSSTGSTKQTMANSGCGPTAMADVVATLKDSSIDPYDLAQLAVADGHRSKTGGTAWSFFPFIQEEFGFSKMIEASTLSALKACLDAGGYVVCSMGPGYWTKGGHFICAWKYDDKYIYANDPASKTRKKQKIGDYMKQRKRFFCFYP
ncbi:MAG: peptidoglycan-binding protein [Clostridia bacterium]|nr:peptidoglycan-binding protein [Clostridia bacterium]